MISFKQFYLREGPHDPEKANIYKPSPINSEALVDWCEEHAPSYLKLIDKHPIWRGMDERVQGIIDTNKFNRVSANTYNHYTLWMDNHNSWAEYPKRSKALICSNDYHVAEGFGSVKLIIPADKNKIGICPDSDLWTSFSHLVRLLLPVSKHEMYLDDITSMLNAFIKGIYGEQEAKEVQESYSALTTFLKKLTPKQLRYYADAADLHEYTKKQALGVADVMDNREMKSMFELFEDGFDPNKSGFKLTTAAQANKIPEMGVELWVQGECAVIDVEQLKEDQVLMNFRKKYNIPKK
jgi:hypothetical protein